MSEVPLPPLAPSHALSPSEAAQLAQTARLSPEERFGVLVSLWSFWQAAGGAARDESPLPHTEWVGVQRTLGTKLLASLVGVSTSSLRRYLAHARPTPDAVAARLRHVALIVGDLAGSCTDIGVRRWFARPRTQLGRQTPAAVLAGAWIPSDEGPMRVRALAAALVGAPAT